MDENKCNFFEKLCVESHITPHLWPQLVIDNAPSWFKTEYMEVDFGEYVNRPSMNAIMHREVLSSLFAQGWYVVAVSNGGECGEWNCAIVSKSVTHTEQVSSITEKGSARNVDKGRTSASENSEGKSKEHILDRRKEHSFSCGSEKNHLLNKEKGSVTATEKGTTKSCSSSCADDCSSVTNCSFGYSETRSSSSSGSCSKSWEDYNLAFARDEIHGVNQGNSDGTSGTCGTQHSGDIGSAHASEQSFGTDIVCSCSDQKTNSCSDQNSCLNSEQTSNSCALQCGCTVTDQSSCRYSNENSDNCSNQCSSSQRTGADEGFTYTCESQGGGSYWVAWQKIKLARKRMQSSVVLQTMVDKFVENYNEGKRINKERYDELVSLYALMLSHSEDELNKVTYETINIEPLIEQVRQTVQTALTKYQATADDLPEDWLQTRIDDINTRFDNLISDARARLISIGLGNTTVLESTIAGIEHQRSHALDAVKDESYKLKLEAYGNIATTSAQVGVQLVEAQVRMAEALRQGKLDPINLRNTVLKWMLEFMERRTDAHPEIGDITTIAERLGYSGGIDAPSEATAN